MKEYYNEEESKNRLKISGRIKQQQVSFGDLDRLYRKYKSVHLDSNGDIEVNLIPFPDMSCNWSKFSNSVDVLYNPESRSCTEELGCYSFTVKDSRYKNIATPVHDPIIKENYENYAHIEIRPLIENEDIYFEPPQGRNKAMNKAIKLEYRTNLKNNIKIDFNCNN